MNTKTKDEELLSVKELADRLGVGPMWVYIRTSPQGTRGGIPHLKVGRFCRFRWSEVLHWIESGKAARF
jgi:excisionase family DNA binding protein